MAYWTSSITNVFTGYQPDDGTGDSIRDAFNAVDQNFQNINGYLSAGVTSGTINFGSMQANNAVIGTLTATNSILGNIGTFGGNVSTSGGLIGSTLNIGNNSVLNTAVVAGNLDVYGYTIIHNNLIPSANLVYNLGSPNAYFANIYTQGLVQVNTVQASSDAGLFQLHANLLPGDTKDVGVFGKFSTGPTSNAYAFFGTQDTTQNFVYKITNTNATAGNSVVYDGVYGNAQLGSLFLSNTVTSSNTLVVAGNAAVRGTLYANIVGTVANVTTMTVSQSIAGNLNVDGNIFSNGAQVITTATQGFGVIYNGVNSVFTGITLFPSTTPATSLSTGAVQILGGVGVQGNVWAGGFYGPLNGVIQTASQPNITSLGTITSLVANSAQVNSLGVTSLTATGGTVSFQTFTASGNVSAANVAATQFNGSLAGLVVTPAQPNITSVGTLSSLAVAGGITGNITSTTAAVGNLTATTVNTNSYTFANGTPVTFTSLANTTEISANATSGFNVGLNLVATGVAAGSYGSGTVVPSFVADSKGRLTLASNNAIPPITFTGSGNTSATANVGQTITFTSTNGVGAQLGVGTININTAQDVRPTATPTFNSINLTTNLAAAFGSFTSNVSTGTAYIGNVVAGSVYSPTIGNVGTTLTGTLATASQTNITALGTLSALTVSGATNLAATTIGGNLAITGPGTYISNNLYIAGTLYVNGNTTTVNSTSITTNDLQLVLAQNAGSTAAANGSGLVTPYATFTYGALNGGWNSNVAIYSTALYDTGSRVITSLTSSGAGNLVISGSAPSLTISLPTVGNGPATVGNIVSIPVISTDSYGRVTSLTRQFIQNISNVGTPQFASLGVGTAASGTTGDIQAATATFSGSISSANFTTLGTSTVSNQIVTVGSQINSLGVGVAASGTAGEIRATNNITAYYSDDRLKTRLGTIENALDKIDQLTGFYYEANETAQALGYEVKREVGVSAQDTQRQMPEIVAPAPIDEQYLTVRYEKFAPLLIEGIKELRRDLRDIKRHLGLE